ncbi:MAG: AAA family ATPase [Deltaproteobacteria bacterium]|nr:AAA family ATPase [Deltaproteobacteria bacterium]
MYIHALSLTNVRGFTALEFPLQRPDGSYAGWNVFAGVNGSGKTTLLRAVATMLSRAGRLGSMLRPRPI